MLTAVHLHGRLGRRFGRRHSFVLSAPVDAVRALSAAFPGDFLAELRQGQYRIVRGRPGRDGRDIGPDMLTMAQAGQPLHIIPVPAGAKRGGGVKVVLGVVLIAAAIALSGPGAGLFGANLGAEAFAGITYGNIALFGASMVLQGAAQLLSPQPKASGSLETADRRASALFNGAVTSVEQGGAVPLIYGTRIRAGGTIISSALTVEDAAGDDGDAGDEGGGQPDGGIDGIDGNGGIGGAGGGGGKGGGGGGSAAKEDPNTLTAKATARILYLVGEGELELIDGARSIFFDDMPLVAADGTPNVEGVSWAWRSGLPDQDHIDGFVAAETEMAVAAVVKRDTPVIRTVADANADAVRVTIQVPALSSQDGSTGDLHGGAVSIAIDVRPAGGGWQEKVSATIEGKTTSPYQRAWRIDLPKGGAPWDIRVRRLTDDHDDDVKVQDKTVWQSYSVIVDGKFTYPDSAVLGLTFDAELYGGRLPTIGVEVRRVGLAIPSNYDPVTRTYAGIWDGTFARGATDNPAWVLWDALTNPRYGLGDVIAAGQIDRYRLYQIAQYCDQLVPSGYKDDRGDDILEPRTTFNGVLATREDAFSIIQAICSSFRGMAFWGSGAVYPAADMPEDPVQLVTPANVLDGVISYSGTARKARRTVAKVSWNDPADGYRQTVEVVELPDLVSRYGWNEVEITAYGCCRRSQARRMGLWLLVTEHAETHTATYTAGLDHMQAAPGQVVAIADPSFAGYRMGGRILSADGPRLTLDGPVTIEDGKAYTLSVMMPDGSVADRPVVAIPGERQEVTLAEPLPAPPVPLAVYVLTASDLAPRPFRVRAVREVGGGRYEVTALLHDPTKYARVEQGLTLDPPDYTRGTDAIAPPENLRVEEARYLKQGAPRSRLSLGWTAPSDPLLSGFSLVIVAPSGARQVLRLDAVTAYDVDDAEIGDYSFSLRSRSLTGLLSRAVQVSFTARGWGDIPDLSVSHLQVDDRGSDTTFVTRDPVFTWRGNFPDSTWEPAHEPAAGAGRVDPRFRDYVVRIYDVSTKTLLRTEYTTATRFQYFLEMNRADSARLGSAAARRRILVGVSIRDTLWRESRESRLEVYNPPLPAPKNLSVNAAVGAIHVTFALPSDLDFDGTIIWRGDTPGFPLDTARIAAQGRDSAYVLPADPNVGSYVRVAHYDVFGIDEANVTDEVFVSAAFVVDTEPPPRPDKPTLTTAMSADGRPQLTAIWGASTARDFASFDLAIKRTDEDESQWQFVGGVTATRYTWTVEPNVSYDVKVRAADTSSNRSGYSEAASITAARDTTPPAAVTGLSADSSFRSVWLSWTNPADADYAYAQIWESPTTSRTSAAMIGTQAGLPGAQSVISRSALDPSARRTYWVASVDSSGNVGPEAGPVTVETASLVLTDFGADFGPIPTVAAVPTSAPSGAVTIVYVKPPVNKLYKWNGAAWGPLVDAGEISGKIVETQIAPGSISTPLLKAGAVTTAILSADAVTADKLAVNAVTAGKIQAGAITATHLSATNLITNRAQIADALIDSGHIRELDAAKIRAGSILSGSVSVNGQSLSDIQSWAGNPATRINQGSTRIDPGKITIAGGVTLGDWRSGVNATEINGGAIAANTIAANKLTIGARGIIVGGGLEFEAVRGSNSVRWTAGNIQYIDENGNPVKIDVSGGSAGGAGHIYWVRGSNNLNFAPDYVNSIGNDRIRLASYYGGSNLVVHHGGTIIDGTRITTGSIMAEQISAGAIRGNHIEANSITGTHIAANAINTQHITAGAVGRDKLALRVIGAAQIDDLSVDRAHIRDLTVNGQKIEDFATSNMNAASGQMSATVGLVTTGKRVLVSVTRGWQQLVATPLPEKIDLVWSCVAMDYIDSPGAGYHEWNANNYNTDAYQPRNFFVTISVVELRK